MPWTSEQILALAPDASSAKSGKELASARKWVSLGHDEASAWGLCQGSGKDPYQTRIDLREPAFKCSCPSRKFPCKHSLGLFLLLTDQPKSFTETKRPPWVVEWLATRQEREEKKNEKKETEAANAADPAVQAKRAADQAKRSRAREEKVAAGLEELDRFVRDLIRQGLASLANKPYSFWETAASRLIDAQAPGLARLLRELGGISSSGDGWQERLLERLAKLHFIIEGYKRIESLPLEVQNDLRTVIGFTVNQDEVLAQNGTRDDWLVLAQRVTEEDRLRVQRSWLWGKKTGRPALLLHFAHASQPLAVSIMPGTEWAGEIVYFPAAYPLRAMMKSRDSGVNALRGIAGFADVSTAFAAYAEALQVSPWIEQFPMPLRNVVPMQTPGQCRFRDQSGCQIPFSAARGEGWRLVALSGGRPVDVFGEWDGDCLLPLAVWCDERYVQL